MFDGDAVDCRNIELNTCRLLSAVYLAFVQAAISGDRRLQAYPDIVVVRWGFLRSKHIVAKTFH
jgi:hypothetical protein